MQTIKILNLEEAGEISKKLHVQGKHIVLVGGCFDILHIGHIHFLTEAQKCGDTLIVLLESDESVKKRKGEDRPIHTQQDRALVLSALSVVDFVVLLPYLTSHADYDTIVTMLKPAIIATTKGDTQLHHKKRQADALGSKVYEVTSRIAEHATSRLAALLEKEL